MNGDIGDFTAVLKGKAVVLSQLVDAPDVDHGSYLPLLMIQV